ncbi:MAG: pyruvate formate-lyase-activating protein [bacterium]|nr:pyruvate formate-lyase-activating protein [bacterium]
MRIHAFESFAAADGPGVRSSIFVSGCPFRCRYCHNPETWARTAAFEMTAAQALERLLPYRPYWGDLGGITVSGGEPMLQAAEVAELFRLAHAAGVSTCLDTAAGCFDLANREIRTLLGEADTVLLDVKLFDRTGHIALTGADNAPVLACARHLAERNVPVWIRRVLVPGLTDAPDDLRATAQFIQTLPNVQRIEVLPYTSLGVHKWHALGLPYTLEDAQTPTTDEITAAEAILRGTV